MLVVSINECRLMNLDKRVPVRGRKSNYAELRRWNIINLDKRVPVRGRKYKERK